MSEPTDVPRIVPGYDERAQMKMDLTRGSRSTEAKQRWHAPTEQGGMGQFGFPPPPNLPQDNPQATVGQSLAHWFTAAVRPRGEAPMVPVTAAPPTAQPPPRIAPDPNGDLQGALNRKAADFGNFSATAMGPPRAPSIMEQAGPAAGGILNELLGIKPAQGGPAPATPAAAPQAGGGNMMDILHNLLTAIAPPQRPAPIAPGALTSVNAARG